MSLSIFNTTQYNDLKDITSKVEEQCIQILNECRRSPSAQKRGN